MSQSAVDAVSAEIKKCSASYFDLKYSQPTTCSLILWGNSSADAQPFHHFIRMHYAEFT